MCVSKAALIISNTGAMCNMCAENLQPFSTQNSVRRPGAAKNDLPLQSPGSSNGNFTDVVRLGIANQRLSAGQMNLTLLREEQKMEFATNVVSKEVAAWDDPEPRQED